MLKDFEPLKSLFKLDTVCIDNKIFKLHCKVTLLLLALFSLLLTFKQYFGEPIHCIVDGEKTVPQKVMETFCWIHSTFTLPRWINGRIGTDVSQPGVASHTDQDEIKYHKYYQWVCFVLYFQAILFYIPRYLWKMWEGGLMKQMLQTLNNPILEEESKIKEKKALVDYLFKSVHRHNSYAFRFFFCEVLNFVNVFGQIYLMDNFLDGEFTTYGYSVIGFSELEPEERVDPMSLVFPKVTKCTFHKYGPTGSVQSFDSLCVLPLNILNEKIYIILFIWFGLLSIISGCELVYRACLMSSRTLRMGLLCYYSGLAQRKEIELITKKCNIGDWFILCQLSKNIDPITFQELIGHIYCRSLNQKDDALNPKNSADEADYFQVSKTFPKENLIEVV